MVYGWLVNLNWAGQWSHGIKIYPAIAYRHAIWMLPVAFFVAMIFAMLIRETRCQSNVVAMDES